ncbi:carboxylesterase family protein [Actinomyces ruminis]|uniref:Carboxylesterase/lipase family protein n=1 Tax=Actinomyces ruminis TaxID=1937003 RepID=A0ABX4MCM7_9ACTO|nr:carboxylesterase family protein [Actinomyces ruminis]PHP53086.1 carboxylesterase/lipase family protein [Actinomyces ruminis]
MLHTAIGTLRAERVGSTADDGAPVYRILGIPYAHAERFQEPEPVISGSGDGFVNSGRGQCFPQRLMPGFINLFLRHFQLRPEWQPRRDLQTEDSLRLNVWTSGPEPLKPVLVFIHGGDCGSGTLPIYDGTHLAEQGIVVVTVTYRIGVFGHLHVVDGDRISCDRAPLDQQAALRWVKANISVLGGDPDRITLMGHCGGAQYALYQALNPDNRDLFHRLILCSGQRATPQPLESASEWEAFTRLLEANRIRDYHQLTTAPVGRLLRLTQPTMALSTTMDQPFFKVDPRKVLSEGAFPHVPVLVGSTADEFSMIEFPLWYRRMGIATTQEEFERAAARLYGSWAEPIAASLRPEAVSLPDLQIKMMELLVFHSAALNLMERFAAYTRVYGYRFEYVPNLYRGLRGAYHGAEVAIFFGNLDRMRIPITADNRRAMAITQRDWLGFVRDGSMPGRPAFDERAEITRYRGEGEAVRFPHLELLRELEGTDLARRVVNTYMSRR